VAASWGIGTYAGDDQEDLGAVTAARGLDGDAAVIVSVNHPTAAAPGTDPPMPGMATRREVARLAVTRGRQADLLFCQLMRPHHLGALHMIDEEVAHGHRPEVIALAEQMRTGQQKEINLLSRIVTELNAGGRSVIGPAWLSTRMSACRKTQGQGSARQRVPMQRRLGSPLPSVISFCSRVERR
jgi:hypothetical protein